jgi:isoamylase
VTSSDARSREITNAYAQDNEITWVGWAGIDEGRSLIDFVRRVIAIRQALPVLRRNRFFTGLHNDEIGVKDVTWLTPVATEMALEQWTDGLAKCLGVMFDGRAQTSGIRRPASDATALLVFNSHHDVVRFTLPEVVGGARWERLIDTNLPAEVDITPFDFGREYEVTGRSLLLFALKPEIPRGIIRKAQEALRTVAAKSVPVPATAEPQHEPAEEKAPQSVS